MAYVHICIFYQKFIIINSILVCVFKLKYVYLLFDYRPSNTNFKTSGLCNVDSRILNITIYPSLKRTRKYCWLNNSLVKVWYSILSIDSSSSPPIVKTKSCFNQTWKHNKHSLTNNCQDNFQTTEYEALKDLQVPSSQQGLCAVVYSSKVMIISSDHTYSYTKGLKMATLKSFNLSFKEMNLVDLATTPAGVGWVNLNQWKMVINYV